MSGTTKARAAVTFRRETRLVENGMQSGLVYQLSLDGVIGSRGGIPLVEDEKIIWAVGAAGAGVAERDFVEGGSCADQQVGCKGRL